jgi:hemerythrin-like domain-containing protein
MGGASALLSKGCAGGPPQEPSDSSDAVSPGEDLMREHGILNRVLLIYEEFLRRLHRGEELPSADLAAAAGIIRTFIEDYHERLEEEELFPHFEQAGRHVELLAVLKDQHRAGRRLTSDILDLARPETLRTPQAKADLSDRLSEFVRMLRPHEAREDTVLFPALHDLLGARDLDALGEKFENREQALFGKDGFEDMVHRTSVIEQSLGLFELSQFTPGAAPGSSTRP